MKKGFTLVEMMIVVAIIAILSAIALPVLGESIKKANDSNVIKVIGALRAAVSSGIDHNEPVGFLYSQKISELKIYLAPPVQKILYLNDDSVTAFDDTSDVLTSYQIRAGTAINGGGTSVGSAAGINGIPNVVEIFYNNREGKIFADGVGVSDLNTKTYRDTKRKYWKDY